VLPLKEAIFVNKSYIVECNPNQPFKIVKTLDGPPEQLLRPGIAPQMHNNAIKQLLFMGGNESKLNYLLDFTTNEWKKAGTLPDFHIVTE
jgi:hypothetical protein